MRLFYIFILLLSASSLQAQELDVRPPPPPIPPLPKKRKPNRRLTSMPRFYNEECELLVDDKAKKDCSDKKVIEYIQENLKYSNLTKSDSLEGIVVIQFIIKKNGFLEDIKVVRSIGREYGAEAKRMVESMNKLPNCFIPGYVRNRATDVYFNLPVKFYKKN